MCCVLYFPFLNFIEQAHNKHYCPFNGGGCDGDDEDDSMSNDNGWSVES